LELVWNAPSTAAQLRNVAASTSGLYTLNTSKVKSILVPVPAIRDQELLVESAASTRTMLNEAAAKAGWAATKAAGLRSALLYTAFTGALVPQDPDDEPASVLLNRIRARRAVGAKPAKRKRAPRTTSQTAPQTSGRPVSSGTQEALPL
jgi:type I restriction enzyme S subunit